MSRAVEKPTTPLKPMRERSDEPVVVAVAGVRARVAVEGDGGLLEADERDQPAQEAVRLAEAAQLVDHAPVDQPEVAGVARDLDVAEPVDHPVADHGDDALRPASRPCARRRCA